jgi:hypothetical protein
VLMCAADDRLRSALRVLYGACKHHAVQHADHTPAAAHSQQRAQQTSRHPLLTRNSSRKL